jgi:hypothetical protein
MLRILWRDRIVPGRRLIRLRKQHGFTGAVCMGRGSQRRSRRRRRGIHERSLRRPQRLGGLDKADAPIGPRYRIGSLDADGTGSLGRLSVRSPGGGGLREERELARRPGDRLRRYRVNCGEFAERLPVHEDTRATGFHVPHAVQLEPQGGAAPCPRVERVRRGRQAKATV